MTAYLFILLIFIFVNNILVTFSDIPHHTNTRFLLIKLYYANTSYAKSITYDFFVVICVLYPIADRPLPSDKNLYIQNLPKAWFEASWETDPLLVTLTNSRAPTFFDDMNQQICSNSQPPKFAPVIKLIMEADIVLLRDWKSMLWKGASRNTHSAREI